MCYLIFKGKIVGIINYAQLHPHTRKVKYITIVPDTK